MEKIIVAGFGGQGILFTGKLLAQAAMEEGKFTTYFPSYGVEMRGGTAHCLVTISHEEIASPMFKNPSAAIFLNEPSVKKILPQFGENDLVVMNSSLIRHFSVPEGIKVVWIPATEIALELGDGRVANSAALGAFLTGNKTLSPISVKKALKALLTGAKSDFLDINLKALEAGADYE